MLNNTNVIKAKNNMQWLLTLLLFCAAFNANAGLFRDWEKTEITKIKKDVVSTKDKIEGNISDVSDEFKEQVDILRSKGELLKDTAEQLLDWLNAHKEEYLDFAGSSRCGGGTPCDIFRNELQTFVQEFSLLSDRFPIVEKLGLSDAPVITKLLDRLPPILLFPLYETMQRMPDWREMPSQLTSIYDEIGDPDVFSVRLSPLPDTATSEFTTSGFSVAALNIRTPTERFCDRMADRLDGGIDPVRLNRIKLYVSSLTATFNVIGEVPPKDQNVEILGEGGSLPIPNTFKMVVHAINFVREAVDTRRSNLDICRARRDDALGRRLQLEIQVAQCLQLTDFILPGKRDEIYNLVVDKVDEADTAGLSVSKSRSSLNRADVFRNSGMWKEAYLKLCDTYKKIGE